MHTLSAFQLLPEHVVRLIVDHVACPGRQRLDGTKIESNVSRALQIPLLWVCHNFRVFVFTRFCREYVLYLCSELGEYQVTRRSWPNCLQGLDCYPTNRFAKELEIVLDAWDVYSGKALQQLSSTPYDGCAFPLVRALTFDIRLVNDRQPDGYSNPPPDSKTNITAFVQRVKEMAPAVSVIYQDGRDADYKSLEYYDSHAILLISQLYRIVKTTVVSGCNLQLVMNPDLAPIGNLTSIDCGLGWLGYHILALARLNAPTLQTFSISSRFDIGICGLIRDPFGNKYVDYPCLRTLIMNNAGVPPILQRSTFEGVVPFPSLRHLAILSHYPYGDDVLFRGNRATLEILSIALYPETVAILKKYAVFTPTSHPKLHICTCSFMEDGPSAFNAASNYLKFALSIAPAASVRVFPGLSEFRETVQPALSILEDYAGIQVLSLPYVHLLLWKAIVLIKSLPVLSDLHTWAPILGAIPQGVTETDLPEYVRSTYSPMGKRFRCWHFECTQLDDLDGVATCMLLLALACPNFDYAAVDKACRMPFMEEIVKQIAKPEFNLYAPRLQRLLFTDYIE